MGLLLLFTSFEASAQKLKDFFHGDTLVVAGDTLPYLSYSTNKRCDTSQLPLIIFLHGAGERGSDNQLPLTHCVRFFMEDTVRHQYAFRMIVPQCGLADRWAETDWTLPSHRMPEVASRPMQALLFLIDSLSQSNLIDTDRIYVVGISMGGFGVWDLLQRRPTLCAAAVPICGGGDTTLAATLTDIPIRIFHGAKDRLVKPERSIQMYQSIRQAGGHNVTIELFPDLGHACWNRPFEESSIIPWLFQQRKTVKQ